MNKQKPQNDVHELKIQGKYFDAVLKGTKTFELRKFDRDFKVGDYIVLKEIKDGHYTGRILTRQITYILGGGQYGLASGYCILTTTRQNRFSTAMLRQWGANYG